MRKPVHGKGFAVTNEMLFFAALSIGPVAQLDRATAF